MIISSIIVDDFYNDPHETREFALQQEFHVVGNYPGFRSKPFYNESVVNLIQDIVFFAGGKITNWSTDEYNGAFQYATQRDRSWMHSDQTTTCAGICFLTPNAPITAGTGLFRHKETGIHTAPLKGDGTYDYEMLNKIYLDSQDMTKWEMVDFIGNVYNRLVIYQGDLFHTSLDYFGTDINNGRLFQTFFFDTEN